jgi:hypothetical protein
MALSKVQGIIGGSSVKLERLIRRLREWRGHRPAVRGSAVACRSRRDPVHRAAYSAAARRACRESPGRSGAVHRRWWRSLPARRPSPGRAGPVPTSSRRGLVSRGLRSREWRAGAGRRPNSVSGFAPSFAPEASRELAHTPARRARAVRKQSGEVGRRYWLSYAVHLP